MWRSMRSFGGPVLGVAIFAVACADSPTTAPTGPTVESTVAPAMHDGFGLRALMPCPTVRERSASAWILPERGGTVSAPGGSITIPAGAVTQPTLVTLTIPRAWYAAVDIRANGREAFTFEKPVEIEIDYSRCRGRHVERDHDVGIVDRRVRRVLERFDGRDDRASRRIKVDSDHLTTYVVLT